MIITLKKYVNVYWILQVRFTFRFIFSLIQYMLIAFCYNSWYFKWNNFCINFGKKSTYFPSMQYHEGIMPMIWNSYLKVLPIHFGGLNLNASEYLIYWMHDTSSKQRACRLLNYQVHSGAIHDHLGSDHHSYFISVTTAKKNMEAMKF